MGQEQSGLHTLQQPEAEEWEPPTLQDHHHKQLAEKAEKAVLQETNKDNQGTEGVASQSTASGPAPAAQQPGNVCRQQQHSDDEQLLTNCFHDVVLIGSHWFPIVNCSLWHGMFACVDR